MTIQEAITKAVEGGWSMRTSRTTNETYNLGLGAPVRNDGNFPVVWVKFVASPEAQHGRYIDEAEISFADVLLDPLFWQALGKSMGWGMEDKGKDPWSGEDYLVRGEWQAQWHRLIDHLAEGKDIESFFAPL